MNVQRSTHVLLFTEFIIKVFDWINLMIDLTLSKVFTILLLEVLTAIKSKIVCTNFVFNFSGMFLLFLKSTNDRFEMLYLAPWTYLSFTHPVTWGVTFSNCFYLKCRPLKSKWLFNGRISLYFSVSPPHFVCLFPYMSIVSLLWTVRSCFFCVSTNL